MARLPILVAPNPILKTRATPVDAVDDTVARLMEDMLETMYAAPGIGLAAPQVGVSKRVLVMDVSGPDAPADPIRMANPEIIFTSPETSVHEEGCLSFPDQFAAVTRPAAARVRWLDQHGAPREETLTGLAATCVQHEMDHLDGVVFVDHLSALRRSVIMRRLRKRRREPPALPPSDTP